jgi:hypothetical protein
LDAQTTWLPAADEAFGRSAWQRAKAPIVAQLMPHLRQGQLHRQAEVKRAALRA